MKVIIAGTRGTGSLTAVDMAIKASGFYITELVSGGASGPDTFGIEWATLKGIPVSVFRPDWKLYGKAAGPIRNREMARYADALVALWDGKSNGTKNMIEEMRSLRLPVYVA